MSVSILPENVKYRAEGNAGIVVHLIQVIFLECEILCIRNFSAMFVWAVEKNIYIN